MFPSPDETDRSHTLLRPSTANGNGWVDTKEPIRILLVSHVRLLPFLADTCSDQTGRTYQSPHPDFVKPSLLFDLA